jgi:hypothetical protein
MILQILRLPELNALCPDVMRGECLDQIRFLADVQFEIIAISSRVITIHIGLFLYYTGIKSISPIQNLINIIDPVLPVIRQIIVTISSPN